MSWYYLDTDAKTEGPVTSSFILEKYHWRNGEITEHTHVWEKELVPQWSELRENYTILVNDVIDHIPNGEATKQLLQFIMNPYTVFMHYYSSNHGNKEKPIGQATVEIEYKGYLAGIAAANPQNDPLIPFIQNREIIQLGLKKNAFGLEMCLYNMSPGDKCMTYIPWRLAYGDKGAGNLIPPKCDVLFDLKVHKIIDQGVSWTIVKFDKWKQMKKKWNASKATSNILHIQSDFESIPYQNGKAGTGKESGSSRGPPPAPGAGSTANTNANGSGPDIPLDQWLESQKLIPRGLRDKFTDLGITWYNVYMFIFSVIF